MEFISLINEDYTITTDKSLMQLDAIHRWLSTEAYWSKNIPYKTVESAFNNSFCIAVLHCGKQIGYARLITDYTTHAYLADVYIEQAHRGKGLSKQMMQVLMDLDWVKKLRRIMLATVDAKGLYEKFGFAAPKHPDRLMEVMQPAIYGDINNPCK